MRHAYLIIAHNEPEILKRLVGALDDERNDIYVHIDRKAPFDGRDIKTRKAGLFILPCRIDARWGDFSLVEVELALFGAAHMKGSYAYYHLLSGVDLPIKSQDYIHAYCQAHAGTEFIGFAQNATEEELNWRSRHYFLFSRNFNSRNPAKRLLRKMFVLAQDLVGCRRIDCDVKKGAQWCSVTHEFVGYLLYREDYLRRHFSHTYCPDELVMQTLCWNSAFRERVFSLSDEFAGCKRYIKWVDGKLQPLSPGDLDDMRHSDRWFARKFNHSDLCFLDDVLSECTKRLYD